MDRAGINLLTKDNYGTEATQGWGPSMVAGWATSPGTSGPHHQGNHRMAKPAFTPVRLALDGGVHGVARPGSSLVREYLPNHEAKARRGEKGNAVKWLPRWLSRQPSPPLCSATC